MPDYTTNYNLEKPNKTEKYNVDVQNNNMDKIDTTLKNLSTQMTELATDTMKLGSNTTVNKVKAAELKTDTRTTDLIYTDGNLTQVLEKDGETVIKTTTLNYDGDGNLTSVVEEVDGVSVTSTLNYNLGQLGTVTKAVV